MRTFIDAILAKTIYEKDAKMPDHWNRVEELFNDALKRDPAERNAFLELACAGDPTLRNEVESLLASDEKAAQESFLNSASPQPRLSKLSNLEGEIIDQKYRIDQLLGQGGMGAVFRATHIGTDRNVAVKVISPQFMAHKEFVERFRREARAMGRLRHPNVVNVTDFGSAQVGSDKIAYLVMEYLDGSTLGQLMKKRGKLPLQLVVDIVEQTSLAVEEAHKQGIIHRDLKPDNIWLEPNGRGGWNVKVLDFGLAKLRDASAGNEEARADAPRPLFAGPPSMDEADREIDLEAPTKAQLTEKDKTAQDQAATIKANNGSSDGEIDPRTVPAHLTRAGMVLGTPLYMSPEQCRGGHLDSRSDIYSLGVIVYEMLAGETPFRGETHQLIYKHSEMPPPPLRKKRWSKIPKSVEILIMSALAKNASQRPVTAGAFAAALRAAVEGETPIMRSAFDLFRRNFAKSLFISAAIYSLITALNCLLLIGSQIFIEESPGLLAQIVHIGRWPFVFLSILFANTLNTAAHSLIAEQAIASSGSPSLLSIINALRSRAFPLLMAMLGNLLEVFIGIFKLVIPGLRAYISNSLFAPIIMLENLQGRQALRRSNTLTRGLNPIAASIQVRELLIDSAAVLGPLFVLGMWNDLSLQGTSMQSVILIILSITLMELAILAHPFCAIAQSIFYFKAKQAAGETLRSLTDGQFESRGYAGSRITRKWVIASALPFIAIFWLVFYFLYVPPAEPLPKAERPVIEKIPDEENSWKEYDLAIQDLFEVDWRDAYSEEPIRNLRNLITGNLNLNKAVNEFSELNQEQIAYLDRHKEAIEHLKAGAARPKFQYNPEMPNSSTHLPTTIEIGWLCNTAALAQALRIEKEGQIEEAAKLRLAAYRMATDLATEPNSFQLGRYYTDGRTPVIKSMLYSLNNGGGSAAGDLETARRIAEIDDRMPNPYQTVLLKWRLTESSMEDWLVYGKRNQLGLPDVMVYRITKQFPGFRARLYKNFMDIFPKQLEMMQPGLENWDLDALRKHSEEFSRSLNNEDENLRFLLSFSYSMSSGLTASFVRGAEWTLSRYYIGRANGAALQVLAASLAYKKIHGKFPVEIKPAMEELGLKVPIDPATRKPVGYRLEDGKPVVWLAGLDGKDDGGRASYDQSYYNFESAPGCDLIYRLGEMPLMFEDGKKK